VPQLVRRVPDRSGIARAQLQMAAQTAETVSRAARASGLEQVQRAVASTVVDTSRLAQISKGLSGIKETRLKP
jgi:hypothetical protein